MAEAPQNFKDHARIDPLYHQFLVPILLLHLVWTGYNVIRRTDLETFEGLLLAIGLVVMGIFVRVNALRAQDRVIRLEEQLRFERLGLAGKAGSLSVQQIVALRFASDNELPELIDQVTGGKLQTQKEIKAAIKTWRPDYVRV